MPKLSGIQEDLAWVDGRYLEVFRKIWCVGSWVWL